MTGIKCHCINLLIFKKVTAYEGRQLLCKRSSSCMIFPKLLYLRKKKLKRQHSFLSDFHIQYECKTFNEVVNAYLIEGIKQFIGSIYVK